ncbi:MAG: arginine--tRNA ligase [Oscillospiraceae bacterium]|jgi:arginyl-tRNA synthetase
MFDPSKSAMESAKKLIDSAIRECIAAGELRDCPPYEYGIEIPADPSHGDISSNAALAGARYFRTSPRDIAEAVCRRINLEGSMFEKCEPAGAGFINFFLSPSYYASVVEGILKEGSSYGRTDLGKGKKLMVEFVSANPTGPMHLGNARGGALGDCLASVLSMAGYDVWREFYVNDTGNQINNFGLSLEARYMQVYDPSFPFPEDGYHGEDITGRAREFADIHGDSYVSKSPEERQKALIDYALPLNIQGLRDDLLKYRISYDEWFLESSLYKTGTAQKVLGILKDRGLTYEKDGAVWYRATEFGGEKDEVLVRANGFPTYFASDIAYHYNKFVIRGFDRVVNVWGADHHGHVARLKGSMDALGIDSKRLDIVLMQLVETIQGGEKVRMSKRTGKAITLSTLLDDISVDAARFFFNLREPSTHMEFDLDLATRQDSDNPVYYVQYAHARIKSILKSLEASGADLSKCRSCDCSVLTAKEEKALIQHLSYFPSQINLSAEKLDPSIITKYTMDVASLFHKFYTACRVKGEPDEIMYPRAALCMATMQTLENCLGIMKVTAPDSM